MNLKSRSAAFSVKRFKAALRAAISLSVRHGRSLKMMKKIMPEAGKMLLFGAAVNLPFWLYIAGVL